MRVEMTQDTSCAGESRHQEGVWGLMTLKVMVHNGIAVSELHSTRGVVGRICLWLSGIMLCSLGCLWWPIKFFEPRDEGSTWNGMADVPFQRKNMYSQRELFYAGPLLCKREDCPPNTRPSLIFVFHHINTWLCHCHTRVWQLLHVRLLWKFKILVLFYVSE